MLELVGRQLHLVDFHDGVPELLVLLLEHDDHARGLRVEGAGDVLHCVGDELFDAGVGDCGFGGHLVVGAAGCDGVGEGFGLGHCGRCSCGGWICMLVGVEERRVEGNWESVFIVGQDSSDWVSEGCGVAKDTVRFGRCHVADLGDLVCDC